MTRTGGADAGTDTQHTPDVSQWWQTVTPLIIADASRVVNAFFEGLKEPLTTPNDSKAFDVARAITVRLLMADPQPLETLLANGQRAEDVLIKGLRATVDPRREPEFKMAKQTAGLLEPVLRMCAGMLPLSTAAHLQRQTVELAEALRHVSIDVAVLPMRFGTEKSIKALPKIVFREAGDDL